MKQIIVMIAMLILGIGIGTMVMGFSEQAQDISEVGTNAVSAFNLDAVANAPAE
ncbi:MAG TPA: hypothetical protein VFC41_04820 [Anaerovoracaceae bacterium]|nr:hypothetical protein [Anaerovoracaceae bacterium]